MIDLREQSSSRESRTTAAVVSLITLCLYLATLSRTVGSFDVGDSQVSAATLGIPHQTGYPLWTLLGYVWTHLTFWADPAFMMNLLTAIFGAATAGLLVLFGTRIGLGRLPAAVGGLVWAFSTEVWLRITQAEVQSLHTFLTVLLLLLWARAEENEDSKSVVGMFLVTGLGLAHHRLMVVAAFPLLLWFFARHWRMAFKPSLVAKCAVAVTVPLLTYLYLPLRAAADPTIVNADMSKGTMFVIRGDVLARNGSYFTIGSIKASWHGLATYGALVGHTVGLAAGLLALLGVVVMIFRAPRFLIGFVLLFGALVYVEANRLDPQSRHFLLPIAFVAVAAAFGVERLLVFAKAQQSGRSPRVVKYISVAAVVLAAALPASIVASNYSRSNRSADHTDELTAEGVLGSAPQGAVIWSYWDLRTTLEYLHYVRHVRPDVFIPDHRAYARYGCSGCEAQGDPVVARGLALDPQLRGRAVFFLTVYQQDVSRVGPTARATLLREISGPYGFDRAPAFVYFVEPTKI